MSQLPEPTVDLTNCDREPIHIPGSIQPHGCLLACDMQAATVLRHSLNVPEMLGVAGEVNGRPLEELLGSLATHQIRNALSSLAEGARPGLLLDLPLAQGRRFDVAVHRYKSNAIIELEPAEQGTVPLHLARTMIGRISEIADIDRLITQSSKLVRSMLGYDRVMIYRFEQDGSGKVVAESKQAYLESFLGQYFPASDIPAQARTLYLRNTIRIISDASGAFVAVAPRLDASGEALDLSFAHLRSVSPIHCEYLRNMGVAASMSISIILDGALWGLIACHHYAPKVLPMSQRIAAEMFGCFLSLQLQTLRQKRTLETAVTARQALDRFLRQASHFSDIGEALVDALPDFARLIPCDGIGLWMDGRWTALGSVPPQEAIAALARHVGPLAEGRVWATHALSLRHLPAEEFADVASGVLVVPLSQLPRDYLFYFRKELVQTLDWAGNPEKSYETGPLGDRLTPRKSFAIWKETVHRQAQPWTESEREVAEATRAAVVEIVLRQNELMADERAKADVRMRMLNEELNHRVKNILAVIKSLVGHPVQEGRNLRDYVVSLKGRIQALAFAHDQVVRGDGGGTLADLMAAELTPYRGQGAAVALEGPPVWLDSRAFSVMALMLHELATNAAKYGALSRPAGRLDVAWRFDDASDCLIDWRESGGPRVSPPSRSGFGTALIDRSIPYDLGGESRVHYDPAGLTAHFRLPARYVARGRPEEGAAPPREAFQQPAGSTLLRPEMSLLVVEDQMLIAMDLEGMLGDHGLTRVVTANSAPEALARLQAFTPDLAVLDVNLGHETSIPVAEYLQKQRVPFVFATGYGDSAMIPKSFAGVPIVRKPYDGAALIAALNRVVEASRQTAG